MSNNKTLFDGMVLFCAVVESESFSAAARQLKHSASHVSKEIARLEARLGSRLLNRTTRAVSLTETGRIYYQTARRLVEDANAMEDRVQTLGDRPFGELKISIPTIFAHAHLYGNMAGFMARFPEILLNIDVSDRYVDVIGGGYDCVVRGGNLVDSGMIARELMTTRRLTLASPHYLHKFGTPVTPQELAGHTLIDYSLRALTHSWEYAGPDKTTITIPVSPSVRCNDARMEFSMAVAGAGITRLPQMVCGPALEAGHLVMILEDYEFPPIPMSVLYPSRTHLAAKTRVFVDFLVETCRETM
ncbi:MAG: LysR family transcriptional regulator [Cohaesibacteraceae bacterium]|nr:LysR family transcriptional regulator [Cohaesibacteraceae bacterium]